MKKRHVIPVPEAVAGDKLIGAPISAAVKAQGVIYCSGATAYDPETGRIVSGTIETETHRVLKNLQLVLEASGSSLDRVLKVNVYLDSMVGFDEMNVVFQRFFSKDPPARTTIACELAWGVHVEMDCIALCDDCRES